MKRAAGFTLIELLLVAVLVGVLAALGGLLVLKPVQAFGDQARRAALVDVADLALGRISRELRHALPNSVRVATSGGLVALEFLQTTAGGRYRARPESDGSGDPLAPVLPDSFDVLGDLAAAPVPGPAGACGTPGGGDCLVIYNTGTGPGHFSAYRRDNVASITAFAGGVMSLDNGAPWSWPFPIPADQGQRFFVVRGPVSYVCDSTAGTLRRYAGYAIADPQPLPPPGGGALLADRVSGCAFSYQDGGPAARRGLVTLDLSLTDAGETVRLVYQVHVLNMP
ncbi:MAG: hypothetical protein KatS3mg121_1049 [Gammaproteobacteria bacterium]|nr:MAG: hypothetical protein KatS3mg121_1049 [Gammaproteobacteria bacterium]